MGERISKIKTIPAIFVMVLILWQLQVIALNDLKAQNKNDAEAEYYFKQGISYMKKNNHNLDKSIESFKKAIDLGYKNPAVAYYFIAGIYSGEKADPGKAIEYYSKAIEVDPNYSGAIDGRGVEYFHMGEIDKALADFNRIIKNDPNYMMALYNRGVVYISQGESAKAIEDLSKVIEKHPNHADSYYHRGLAYHESGDSEKAEADYKIAAKLKPEYAKKPYSR